MEKETTSYNSYTREALRSFVPALALAESIANKFESIEDITWFYTWKALQPGFRALFSPR